MPWCQYYIRLEKIMSALIEKEGIFMKKSICILIAAVMFIYSFASCSGNTSESLDISDDSQLSETEQTETEAPQKTLPRIRYDGERYVIFVNDRTDDYKSLEFTAEEINGTPVNDAVFERNSKIEDNFGIELDIRPISDPQLQIRKSVQSGEHEPDLVLMPLYLIGSLALEGMLCDLNSFEYINFDSGSWDKKAAEQLSMGGVLPTAVGDMNINDKDMTWCLFFNKNLAENYGLTDIYSLVKNGKWTFDKFEELIHGVTVDLNGDGLYDDNDLWGHVTVFARSAAAYTYSMGGYLVVKNPSTDYPEINIGSERIYAAYDKIRSLFFDSGECHDVVTMPFKGFAHQWRKTESMFGSEQILFYGEAMQNAERFRGYETDFGIIPLPTWSEGETGNNMLWTQAYSNVVPLTAGFDPSQSERDGIILEALQEYSTEYIKPAYYEKSLKGKYSRDEASTDMIDIIFSNRYYDIAAYYEWGGISEAFMNCGQSGSTNLRSTLESLKNVTETEISDMISKLKEKQQ